MACCDAALSLILAVDVGMAHRPDREQLDYATQHQLVLVTNDQGFAGSAMNDTRHTGVVCWTGTQNDFGGQVRKLAEFAETHSFEHVTGQVFWIK